MAVNIPSLDLCRGFAPLGKRCSASSAPSEALPVISPTVSCGRRSAGKCSCKLRSNLKFDAPSRATFACSGEKFVDHIATSGNQQEVTSIIPQVQRREVSKFGAPSRTMVLGIIPQVQEQDFTNTPVIPVYVMLPLGTINTECELANPDNLINQLKMLRSINVDGVMVDCWWGIVEAREIGSENPDIFFTDKKGRRNQECLYWGIDNERVQRDMTALEVYFEFMESFHAGFEEFFRDGLITEIEIGLGPCGELRYPSYPAKHG
ncbi:UNVERIFIED_CONTAM: Beta-amylase 7 [Sesamum calycinum]|uniref:Beta-amylase n=1 Tax=Sesamum calycinum TaxID=2727403 RepID=A0AAW2Q7L2_9LAMI